MAVDSTYSSKSRGLHFGCVAFMLISMETPSTVHHTLCILPLLKKKIYLGSNKPGCLKVKEKQQESVRDGETRLHSPTRTVSPSMHTMSRQLPESVSLLLSLSHFFQRISFKLTGWLAYVSQLPLKVR